VEVGVEESLLRHYVPSLGILWDPHAERMRISRGEPEVPVT
jgi:hypothetical protein